MRLSALIVGLLCLILLAACDSLPEDASGPVIFEQSCASCHGGNGSGGVGPPLDAGSNASEQPDGFLRETVTRGRGRMPSFEFTDPQMDRLVTHLRSLQ